MRFNDPVRFNIAETPAKHRYRLLAFGSVKLFRLLDNYYPAFPRVVDSCHRIGYASFSCQDDTANETSYFGIKKKI